MSQTFMSMSAVLGKRMGSALQICRVCVGAYCKVEIKNGLSRKVGDS